MTMTDVPARDELMTLEEAARHSGLAVHALRYQINQKRLRFWKERRGIGRILVLREDVDKLAEYLNQIEPGS